MFCLGEMKNPLINENFKYDMMLLCVMCYDVLLS